MLLVNNPGSWSYVYAPLRHAEWHGWTPTDLVFPFFLFAVGVSLTLSLGRQLEAGAQRTALWRRAVRRGLLIVLFGLLLGGFPRYHVEVMRFPGVLQRIGVVYLIAATAWLYLRPSGRRRLAAGLLLGYWAAMMLVPVPGVGRGSLAIEGNLAQYLDNLLLHGHTWKPTWDPEGILSTFPAVATCLLGAFAGDWLRGGGDARDRALRLFAASGVACMLGWFWSAWFPINKGLWTSSYVLLTAGLAGLVLTWLWVVIDWQGRDRWALPLYVFGSNALLAFLGTGLMAKSMILLKVAGPDGAPMSVQRWVYEHWFASWAGPLNGSLAYAIAFVLVWLAILWIPYRRGIFLKV
jgi:predicted acyltransferase